MKQQIRSYFLLFLFLFGMLVPGQTQEELSRLPVLYQHYLLHKFQSPNTSFHQYFKLHYGEGFAQHRSAHDHSRLPMKSGDNHLHTPAPVDLPRPMEIVLIASPEASQPINFKDQAVPPSFLHDIWQPPRSC